MKLEKNQRAEVSHAELQGFVCIDAFCDLVQRLIDSGIKGKTFHYGGLTKLTEFEFAKAFANRFKYDPNLIVPKKHQPRKGALTEEDIFDFSLNTTRIAQTLKIKPLLLEESFDLIEKKLIATPRPSHIAGHL